MNNTVTNVDVYTFEERADYLEIKDLMAWNVETDHFKKIQQELVSKGARLLAGPRGTGKTHQMRYVYQCCIDQKKNPLPVYVTFGRYFRLDPLLVKESNAIQIFHAWALAKIILGLSYTIKKIQPDCKTEELLGWEDEKLQTFIGEVETGNRTAWHDEIILSINCEKTISLLERSATLLKRKRIVLLLDDAALTLTPDYLEEFFDIFRSLKTTKISPKAAVYPGTTQYGPRFHVGHDAQKVSMWFNVEEADYLEFMKKMVKSRFSEMTAKKVISDDIINLFIYCAFGVPRAFIKLINDYCHSKEKTLQSKFNRVLQNHIEDIGSEYKSLVQKLPQYKTIINTGWNLIESIIEKLKQENLDSVSKQEKQLCIGIQQESSRNLLAERMLSFLVEAGLLFPLTPVKHGPDRTYDRYVLHLAFLTHARAFSAQSRGFAPADMLNVLNRKSAKHPARSRLSTLLKTNPETLQLDLPPCASCGMLRLTKEQRFCHNCGSQLVNKSNFERCMVISINDLPLSQWRKDKILKETAFKVVGDIISSENPAKEFQRAHRIGPKRAGETYEIVNGFVEEFLA